MPAVTTREADCGSGVSYRYTWSSDSRALLVHGLESLRGGRSGLWFRMLCVVFIAEQQASYRLAQCPES